MLTEEEIAARVAPLCDAETTDEERAAFVASVRLGAGLDEARRMADALATHLSKLHHEFWHTPSEAMLLNLLIDARWLRDNLIGWSESEGR